jgi:hypothetical protein
VTPQFVILLQHHAHYIDIRWAVCPASSVSQGVTGAHSLRSLLLLHRLQFCFMFCVQSCLVTGSIRGYFV